MSSLPWRFLLLLALLAGGLVSPLRAQERAPDVVVRDFYKLYIQTLSKSRDPFTADRTELKRYATTRLLGEIDKTRKSEDGLGADPFLDAQDFDGDWAKNINVSKPIIKGDIATADVTLKGPEMGTHKLRVTLRQEAGAWKIDKVSSN